MWFPGFERIGPTSGGSWAVDTGHTRLVLHTTEGWNIEGALSVYRNVGVWPHFTVDVRPGGRLIQHIDTDQSAMALYNGSDPTQTNRAGVTLQIEICGFAAETHTYDDAWYQRLAEVIAPICKAHGIPARCTRFYGQGEGVIASESWPGRYWSDRLYPYAGILGHQTVGDGNDHWDPGKLDSERLLNFAFGGGVIIDPITGTQRVVSGGTPAGPLLPLEDEPMDFVRVTGQAQVYLRSGVLATYMTSAEQVNDAARDFKIPATVTEISPRSLAGLVVLPVDMGAVPSYLRSLGITPVEVTAEEGDRWRTYGLQDGKPTHGGFIVAQLFGNVIEAATATRRNSSGQTVEQRTAAEVAAVLAPLLGGGAAVDVAALATAIANELIARVSASAQSSGSDDPPAASLELTEALTA